MFSYVLEAHVEFSAVCTKISEVNLSAFICKRFHQDLFSIIQIQLAILNHPHDSYAVILGGGWDLR